MKEYIDTIRFVAKRSHEYYSFIGVLILLNVCVRVALPIAMMLFPVQIVSWLMKDVSMDQFIQNVCVWGGGIVILQAVDALLKARLVIRRENFRLIIFDEIYMQLFLQDYPNVIKQEGLDLFKKAADLTNMPTVGIGYLFEQVIQFFVVMASSIIYLGLIVQIDATLQLIFLGLVVVTILFRRADVSLQKKLHGDLTGNSKKAYYMRTIFSDTSIAKDSRLYQLYPWLRTVKKEIDKQLEKMRRPFIVLATTEGIITTMLLLILTGFAYVKSYELVVSGQLVPESFLLYATTVGLLATSAVQMVTQTTEMIKLIDQLLFYKRFMTQPSVFNHEQTAVDIPTNVRIELKNVTYTHPNATTPVLDNFSLTIEAGEKLAIVGENGAGKTTLVLLILGLLKADSGDILINGVPIETIDIQHYHEWFAPVFQDSYLWTFTIQETIVQGSKMNEEWYQTVKDITGMTKLMEEHQWTDDTEIVPDVSSQAIRLSGGQLQTLKLAQAVYKNAPVMILDEPTAALDPIAENAVYEKYAQFSENKTSIFISHRLASTRFCDRIIYLSNGQIVEEGTHESLMEAKGRYHTLFETQAYYYKEGAEHEVHH